MATHTTTVLVDDLDGSEATETIRFGLDKHVYSIDLNQANADALRKALQPYVEAAGSKERMLASGTAEPAQTEPRHSKEELDAMRAWGRENGFTVSDRGRVSRQVQEAYRAAHA